MDHYHERQGGQRPQGRGARRGRGNGGYNRHDGGQRPDYFNPDVREGRGGCRGQGGRGRGGRGAQRRGHGDRRDAYDEYDLPGEDRENDQFQPGEEFHGRDSRGNRRGRRNQPPRVQRETRPIGYQRLVALARLDGSDALDQLASCKLAFEKLLQQKEIRHDLLIQLLLVLAVVCSCSSAPATLIDILAILKAESFVTGHLSKHIRDWKHEVKEDVNFPKLVPKLLEIVVTLLHAMLERLPSTAGDVGVAILCLEKALKDCEIDGCDFSQDVIDKFQELQEFSQATESQERTQKTEIKIRRTRNADNEQPPNDFREYSVFPEPHELENVTLPFLRRNVVDKAYESIDEYLDIQYRLLREDFVEPLRKGINQYRSYLLNNQSKKDLRLQDIRLYHDVKVLEVKPSHDGISYLVQFGAGGLKGVKWERTRRLIYGSLVCLSADNFTNNVFAVVGNRDAKQLQDGLVELRFDVSAEKMQQLFSQTFVMAESSAYFEAYRHVLTRLQQMDEMSFPLQEYIIHMNSRIRPPRYVRGNRHHPWDISFLERPKLVKERFQSIDSTNLRLLEDYTWPSASQLEFDDSQMKAFKAALTNELCIIQGPPGTGKTYVGLKIVQTLLANKTVWSPPGNHRPLMIVCFTNHALDQFLEGIMQFFPKGLVRIGGRSSNEMIKQMNIRELRRQRIAEKVRPQHRFRRQKDIEEVILDLARKIKQLQGSLHTAHTRILKEDRLQSAMSPDQFRSLFRGFDTTVAPNLQRGQYIAYWLGALGETPTFMDEGFAYEEDDVEFGNLEEVHQDEIDVMDEIQMMNEQRYLEDEDEFTINIKDVLHSGGDDNDAAFVPVLNLDVEHVDETDVWQMAAARTGRRLKKYIARNLRKTDYMPQEQVRQIRNVWSLQMQDRWKLYRFWVKKYQEGIHTGILPFHEDYDRNTKMLREVKAEEDVSILETANVIAVTTTGAAKYHELIQRIKPPIVVVEEAAEVLEAHIVASLTNECEHLILIGDHQQLRPNPAVYKLAKDYNLDISLFERLINNDIPYTRLKIQHRMRPEISHVLKFKEFYEDLQDHDDVKTYEDVLGVDKNVFYINHSHLESSEDDSRSKSNMFEAEYLTSLCHYFLQQGYSQHQITILTAYTGQLWNFKQTMNKATFGEVRVCAVDGFQGEENDIILLSLVRSNAEGKIGFLSIANRICVALSRAKKGLYCIGNFTFLAERNELWKKITKDLRYRNLIGKSLKLICRNHPDTITEAYSKADFKQVPEGGCKKPCDVRLDCGHVCQLACHPRDREHLEINCTKPCTKPICLQNHRCPRRCYQACANKCYEHVAKQLPCGHVKQVPCYENPAEIKCDASCTLKLTCGHSCKNKCGETCAFKCREMVFRTNAQCGHRLEVECSSTEDECPEPCNKVLKCEHRCGGSCGSCKRGIFHVKCIHPCNKVLICGHQCESMCTEYCPPCKKPCENRCKHSRCNKPCGLVCVPCEERCEWQCRHIKCGRSCGEPCRREACDLPCMRQLKNCRHQCIGLCGEPCPTQCRICDEEEVREIFFGNEDMDNARFVKLEDCRHVIEVTALDKWMNDTTTSSENIIQLKVCPKCKAPIRRNLRYSNMIKQARADVDGVKRHIYGERRTIEAKKNVILTEIRLLQNASARTGMVGAPSSNFFKNILMKIEIETENSISIEHLASLETKFEMLTELLEIQVKACKEFEVPDKEKLYAELQAVLDQLLCWLTSLGIVCKQNLNDWNQEINRLRAYVQYFKAKRQLLRSDHRQTEVLQILPRIERIIFLQTPYTTKEKNHVRKLLEDLKKYMAITTEEERKIIVKAIGLTKGHWFKCPNGHFYAIGECGGATEKGKCPECGSVIGGQNHQLEASNRHAPEVDGSRYAAYSQEANNMINFDLENLH